MEELLLGLLLAGDELHVIHQQQVGLAVFFPHFGGLALPDGVHQLIGQVVALDIGDFGMGVVFPNDVGDGVDQVGLAKAGVSVDEQRVVILGRMVGHRLGGGVSKLVGRAHHESIKGELVGGKAVALFFHITPEFLKGEIVQNLHFEVGGENVVEHAFDVFQEKRLDIAFFKVVGAVQDKRIAPDIHGFQLVEPGGNGRLRQVFL